MKTTDIEAECFIEKIPKLTEENCISDAVETMKKEKWEFLPVVDKNDNLLGSVTEYDLIKLVKQEPTPLAGSFWTDSVDKSQGEKKIREIMSTKTVFVHAYDSADSVLKTMNSNSVYILPVVDRDGKFLGIVRMSTIFKKLLKEGE